ncbi:MAG TPA: hypothetical protein PKC39_09280 [Ferruginibacter sp.]|nr:hypothetical protein [Ferruginibacter sp.]HMP21138.1 hypothetical protein [Ferruginibacter sp.]
MSNRAIKRGKNLRAGWLDNKKDYTQYPNYTSKDDLCKGKKIPS